MASRTASSHPTALPHATPSSSAAAAASAPVTSSSFVLLPPKTLKSKKAPSGRSSEAAAPRRARSSNSHPGARGGVDSDSDSDFEHLRVASDTEDDFVVLPSSSSSAAAASNASSLSASAISSLPSSMSSSAFASGTVSPAPSSIASSNLAFFLGSAVKYASSVSSLETPPAKYSPGRTVSRRAQRLSNLCFLLEGEVDENDLKYLDAHKQTQFAWLLEDEQRLKKWLDFVSQPEEKQISILRGKGLDPSAKVPLTNRAFQTRDSSQCYLRIERRIREMLRKTNLPKGALYYMEQELISCFTKSPSVTLVWSLDNSFARLLAHALCQYYGLRSASEDVDGGRKTFIQNSFDKFVVPEMTLTKLLGL